MFLVSKNFMHNGDIATFRRIIFVSENFWVFLKISDGDQLSGAKFWVKHSGAWSIKKDVENLIASRKKIRDRGLFGVLEFLLHRPCYRLKNIVPWEKRQFVMIFKKNKVNTESNRALTKKSRLLCYWLFYRI